MRRLLTILMLICFPLAFANTEENRCRFVESDGADFTVCAFPADADIRLFWGNEKDEVLGSFKAVEKYLDADSKTLTMAMNAGMYHDDRRPVGLFIADGKQRQSLQTKASYGNFGMVPNGVFYKHNGKVRVQETLAFQARKITPEFATQSGPMLVIDGKLHPKFKKMSTSLKRRNGVGISKDGKTVFFAISEEPVTFYDFATLFRDNLGADNALFFDGVVSRLFDAQSGRSDPGRRMGPIVGVVR